MEVKEIPPAIRLNVKSKLNSLRLLFKKPFPNGICLTHKAYPKDYMRKSKVERIFSEHLKRNRIPYAFHKQVGPYELDFVIGNIVVEIDGLHHDYSKDGEKNHYLADRGYTPLHFTADEIRRRKFINLISQLK